MAVAAVVDEADYNYVPGTVLTSTLWNQSGTIYISVDGKQKALSGYTYNKYCPDFSGTSKCVTGCSNTADSQILYYWLERGYDLDLSVSSQDYFYTKAIGDIKIYASDQPEHGESSISVINNILKDVDLADGDFIAALNFYCGLKNHSKYGSSTSTTWYKSVYTNGTNSSVFKAAGFDSYYFIAEGVNHSASKLFFSDGGISELGYSILRENFDYGEVVRVGIPNHAIYMDGYRFNENTQEYEYHLNYGWGISSSNYSKWYTVDGLKALDITYLNIDISPDIKVRVTTDTSEYYGGSFLRGMERINHIQNDKATTFTFADELAGKTIRLSESAQITSKVDVSFENLNVNISSTASNGFVSGQAMSFDMLDGSIFVNNSSDPYAIRENGTEALTVDMDSSWIYAGYSTQDFSSFLEQDDGYIFSELDDSFLDSITGTAIFSGGADDEISLANSSALFGDVNLGGGDNVFNIESGSLFYGSFAGWGKSLTVNMTINEDKSGPMFVFDTQSKDETFHYMTGGKLNLFTQYFDKQQEYVLFEGYSEDLIRKYSFNLTVGSESFTLDQNNTTADDFRLFYDDTKVMLEYVPGEKPVNIYKDGVIVSSGKVFDDIALRRGTMDSIHISAGGLVTDTAVNDGTKMILSGGSASNTAVNPGGAMYVSATAEAAGIQLKKDGYLWVHQGAEVRELTAESGADLCMDIAPDTYILGSYNGKSFSVDDGKINGYTISRGALYVRNGGKAENINVLCHALYVYDGGIADHAVLMKNGEMEITGSTGLASRTIISSGGSAEVFSSGNVAETKIASGGIMSLRDSSTALSTVISGGSMHISTRAVAEKTSVLQGEFNIYSSGIGKDTVISGGVVNVFDGGTASSTTIAANAAVNVFSGGTAVDVDLKSDGYLWARQGAEVRKLIAGSGADLCMDIAPDTFIQGSYDGKAFTVSDGKIEDYIINRGALYVRNGGSAVNITVGCQGLYVYDGGSAQNITLKNNGQLEAVKGAVLSDITVECGGLLEAFSGASVANSVVSGEFQLAAGSVHSGTLHLEESAVFAVAAGGIIDFSVAGRTSNDDYLINDLSKITGDAAYSMTIDAVMEIGSYKLAQGAADFSGSISVVSDGIVIGSVAVNSFALHYQSRDWKVLKDQDGNLMLEVKAEDLIPPEKPVASADITTLTNKNVIVTALFSTDSVCREFSRDGKNWQTYTGSIVMEKNGTLYFRAFDEAGNVSDTATFTVDYIDKDAPDQPVASADITTFTNKDVTVTALFSADSVRREFSRDEKNWQTYTGSIVMNSNGMLYFRGIDAAGNISATEKIAVYNIDKVPPEIEVSVRVDAESSTVFLLASSSDRTVSFEYSFDNKNWAKGKQVAVRQNKTVYFRGVDPAGNVSLVKSYDVTEIDTEPPVPPVVSADITDPTRGAVTVSAVFSEDSVCREFSRDGKNWQTYTGSIVMEENGTLYFRAIDNFGNISDVSNYTVANIDRLAPEKPRVTADINTATNRDVTVSAVFSEDSAAGEFSYDNENWQSYTGGVVMKENGAVYFRGVDAAGNVSDVVRYKVSNIDKIAPAAPSASADITEYTSRAVTVSAVFSKDSVIKEFSRDGKIWELYVSGVKMTENGTVYFRGTDAAGNISEAAAYTVDNIYEKITRRVRHDIDGNNLSDTLMRHSAGFTGVWLSTGKKNVIKWGDLSTVDSKTQLLGTGQVAGTGTNGQDVFFTNGKHIGAWILDGGFVTGYRGITDIDPTSTDILGLGDFNGDGATDILLRSKNGDVGCYIDGTGWNYFKSLGAEWDLCGIGDLNGDGVDDVIMRHSQAGFAGTWLIQRDGGLEWANLDTLTSDMELVGTGDFNGDGVDDVLLQKGDWLGAWIIENGSVKDFMGIQSGSRGEVEQIGDFNGDGIADLRIRVGNDVGVHLVKGTDSTEWKYFGGIGSEWATSFAAPIC